MKTPILQTSERDVADLVRTYSLRVHTAVQTLYKLPTVSTHGSPPEHYLWFAQPSHGWLCPPASGEQRAITWGCQRTPNKDHALSTFDRSMTSPHSWSQLLAVKVVSQKEPMVDGIGAKAALYIQRWGSNIPNILPIYVKNSTGVHMSASPVRRRGTCST